MKRTSHLYVFFMPVLELMLASSSLHCAAQPAPGAAKNPVKTQEVTRFFELLKAGRAASRNYNVNDVPNWDSKAIVGFVTTGGLTVEDVNAKGAKRYSPDQVEAALTKRAGEVFQSFSHISFLYAKGKKQYSEVRFTEKPGCVVATLATWYELEFITDGGRLKLRKCKYINQDGD